MESKLFDELIGTPPPSTVDVKGIVRRERRERVARRLGGSMAAVLTLAAVGAVAVTNQEPGAPSTPRAGSPTAEVNFRLVYDTRETAETTAARLSEELDRALRNAAPGARWIWVPEHVGEAPKPDGQLPTIRYKEEMRNGRDVTLFGGKSGLVNDGRKGLLGLSITAYESLAGGPGLPAAATPPTGVVPVDPLAGRWHCKPSTYPKEQPQDVQCDEATTAGGARVKIVTYVGKELPSVQHTVSIELPGNRLLRFSVENSFAIDGAPPAQPEPPLTREQAQRIALDIASSILA